MNYQKIYNQIVDRAKQEGRKKGKGKYYESHHILPKCLGGCNSNENLVLLTGREHFLCHWILARIHPEDIRISYAFWGMCNRRSKGQEERYIPSSRTYEEARKHSSKNRVAFFKTEEGKAITAKRIANTDYNIRATKMDLVAKAANTDYATIAKKHRKIILQFNKQGKYIREWPSIKEAGETLKILRSGISNCLTGRTKYSGGFIWKYLN